MRGTLPIVLVCALLFCLLIIVSSPTRAGSDWTVSDHVILEERELEQEGNITVVAGGWLDIRGSSLYFNCTRPLEYTLNVKNGGRLTISMSSSGAASTISPTAAGYPTRIVASSSSEVNIQALTILNCGQGIVPAILIENVDNPIVKDCIFIDCPFGLSVKSCEGALIEGNRLTRSTIRAIEAWSVIGCQIKNNFIEGSQVSIDIAYSTDVLLRSNRVKDTVFGIILDTVDDSSVESNKVDNPTSWAFSVSSCKLIRIMDLTVNGASSAARTASGMRMDSSCSYIKVENCRMSDLDEGIKVEALFGGRDECISFSTISFNRCNIGMNLSSTANFLSSCTFNECAIGLSVIPNRYGEEPSDNRIDECLFRNCTIGILTSRSRSSTIEGSTFRGCSVAVSCQNTSGDAVSNSSVFETKETAFSLVHAETILYNCTIRGGQLALSLEASSVGVVRQSSIDEVELTSRLKGGSTLELHNTTHVRSYDISDDSKQEIYWDVQVTTRFDSGARTPVEGVLKVLDLQGRKIHESCLRSLPDSTQMEVMESLFSMGTVEVRTPHLFNASVQRLSGSSVTTVDRLTRIEIYLDDIAPRLLIRSPSVQGSNRQEVELVGSCRDNRPGSVHFSIRMDGNTILSGTDWWNQSVALEDGQHSIEYLAIDMCGNEAREHQDLFIDFTPPVLVLDAPPANPYLVADDELRIAGSVLNGIGVSIDGEEVPLAGGAFLKDVALPEDGTFLYNITAWDGIANTVSLILSVTRDMTPPALYLDEHAQVTREPHIAVGGGTESPGTTVTLSGTEVSVLPGGRFTLLLDLLEGTNSFEVVAVDRAGNRKALSFEIELDTQAQFEIVWPANGTHVQQEEVLLLLRGEVGAEYRVGSDQWVRSNDTGYCGIILTIHEPENHLSISMRDRVGNVATKELTIIYAPPVVYHESRLNEWILLFLAAIVIGSIGLVILYRRDSSVKGG